MKNICFFSLLLLVAATGAGCSKKKNAQKESPPEVKISESYTGEPFYDVNNESTLDLESLKDDPPFLDLSDIMTSARDQAERGTCSYFSAMALVESAIKKKMNVDVNLSEEYMNFSDKNKSPEHAYEGGDYFYNLTLSITNNEGFLLERDWPYQPSWFGKKSPCLNLTESSSDVPFECFSHNAPTDEILKNKIAGDNFRVMAFYGVDTTDIISILSYYKMPIAIGVPLNNEGWANDGTVTYTETMRENCIKLKSPCVIHAIVLTGYDMNKKVFFFKNSWGEKWGKKGFGTIPFEMIDLHADHDGALVHLKNEIELPANYNQEKDLKLKDFTPMLGESSPDKGVIINSVGQVEEVGPDTLFTTARLYRKKNQTEGPANDDNTEEVILSKEEAKIYKTRYVNDGNYYFADAKQGQKGWTLEAPDVLKLKPELMSSKTVRDLRDNPNEELFIRTTLYVHDDLGSTKLKRTFIPLKQ